MKLPFFRFYTADWLTETRKLTPSAKAAWIDILAIAWNEPERGIYTRQITAMCRELGISFEALKSVLTELTQVAGVTLSNEKVTVLCKRITDEVSHYKNNAIRQARHRLLQNSNADITLQTLDVRLQTLDKDVTAVSLESTTTAGRKHSQQLAIARVNFSKPNPTEIGTYATSIGFNLDAQKFFDHYESNGWRVGRTPMKDWKAAVRTWKRSDYASDFKPAPSALQAPRQLSRPPVSEELSEEDRLEAVKVFRGIRETLKGGIKIIPKELNHAT